MCTYKTIFFKNNTAVIEHEASTSKINEDQFTIVDKEV